MKTIDIATLETVTGGAGAAPIVSPCARLNVLPLGQATGRDLALANRFCGVPLPTAKEKRDAKHIFF
jgi:hypothetical protein